MVNKAKRKKFKLSWGWRDSSMVMNTGCSSRGFRFESQHPHIKWWLTNVCNSSFWRPLLASIVITCS